MFISNTLYCLSCKTHGKALSLFQHQTVLSLTRYRHLLSFSLTYRRRHVLTFALEYTFSNVSLYGCFQGLLEEVGHATSIQWKINWRPAWKILNISKVT